MKVIAATKNKGKIREMQEILAPLDIEIVSQQELGIDVDVEETDDTFVKTHLLRQERLLWFAIILSCG